MHTNIYLDYASATPMLPEVFSAMQPYFQHHFYNPSSLYQEAVFVKKAIEESRATIAKHLGVQPPTITFFDGGTEANNVAILGSLAAWKQQHPDLRPNIITTKTEHSSLHSLFSYLEEEVDVCYIDVDQEGRVNLNQLKEQLCERTVLVSFVYAHGEIGTVQDMKEISRVLRRYRKHNNSNHYPLLHTDAVQALNHLEIRVPKLGVDLMTIAASKIYGPKKISALYVNPHISLEPVFYGGPQEHGLHPGTENIPYIIGFATALDCVRKDSDDEYARLFTLSTYFVQELQKKIPDIIINSPLSSIDLPHIVNITIPHLSSEEIMLRLAATGIQCSVKSACQSEEEGDSPTIMALRKGKESPLKTATQSLRFSLGRMTTKNDITKTIDILNTVVTNMNLSYKRFHD
jgi:cysteine desulfurase